MKKTIAFLIVLISSFASYETARYCMRLSYKENPAVFVDDDPWLWSKMVVFSLVWAGIITLVLYLSKNQKMDNNSYEEYHHCGIWSFALVGIVIVPMLIWLDPNIAYWIIR